MKVFISYTKPDEIVAKKIYWEIKRFFPCWIACEDLVTDHEEAIQQELAAEDSVMVALLSNSTFNSPGQKKEFRIADNFRTETIPVLIEDISESLSDIEYNLRNRIPDKRAFVPYLMHSGQFYLGYKDPEWFKKVLIAIHDKSGSLSDANPILAKLRRADINIATSSRKEIQTIWNLEGDLPKIHIIFDARSTKIINQNGNWEEFISVRGVFRKKGYKEKELLKAIHVFKENGLWGLKNINNESLEFEITNGFRLSMSSPPSIWRNCCHDICANLSGVLEELGKPKSFWDDLSDLVDGISKGFSTGLSIAEQLGIFDQDDDDEDVSD